MISSTRRNCKFLVAEQSGRGRARGRRRTRRAGCRAAGRATRRHRPGEGASPGPRSRPNDRGAASGLSISAAPAAKSETTASIGMPPPAIMIPVWPVARKSASTPAPLNARAIASAVYFLPSAQSVPTVSSRLPLRFRPGRDRDVRRRRPDVDQPPARVARRRSEARECRRARMHAADDVEAGLERLERGREPRIPR